MRDRVQFSCSGDPDSGSALGNDQLNTGDLPALTQPPKHNQHTSPAVQLHKQASSRAEEPGADNLKLMDRRTVEVGA